MEGAAGVGEGGGVNCFGGRENLSIHAEFSIKKFDQPVRRDYCLGTSSQFFAVERGVCGT